MQAKPPQRFDVGTFDIGRRTWIRADGSSRSLSPLECDLLGYLTSRVGVTVSKAELLEQVWGYAPGVKSRAVDNTASRLRSKIDLDDRQVLVSVYGGGYRFDAVQLEVNAEPVRTELSRGLIGREDDRLALETALQAHHLVTLWGPGGVGKTSLARAVHESQGGTWIDLSQSTRPADVVASAALALGVPMANELETSSSRVASALESRGTLAVLDNCEQLEDTVSALFQHWCNLAPTATFLTTSRRPLGLKAEHSRQLMPLHLEDALELLVRRVRDWMPHFDVGGDRPGWLEVLRLLDGLPLAVVLFAPRVGAMPPKDLCERLERSLNLVRQRRATDRPERHRALSRSLQWSWSLLDDAQREALISLAQIPGPFELNQAESVIGGPDALDLFDDLLHTSWMHRTPGGEHALFRSVQTFVSDAGDPSVARAAEDRRRRWLITQVDIRDVPWRLKQVLPVERAVWRGLDHAPLESAELVRSIFGVNTALPADRLIAMHDSVTRRADPTSTTVLETRLNRVEILRTRRGVEPKLIDEVRDIRAIAADVGAVDAEIRAWRIEGTLARMSGRRQEARSLLGEVAEVALHRGLHSHRGNALNELGILAFRDADYDGARVLHQDALVSYRLGENLMGQIRSQANLGKVLRALGRHSEAEDVLRRVLGDLEPHMIFDRGVITTNLANLFLVQRRFEECAPLLQDACTLFERAGAARQRALATASLALCELGMGRLAEGEARAVEAVGRARPLGDARIHGQALGIAAIGALAQRDHQGAQQSIDAARALYEGDGLPAGVESLRRLQAVADALANRTVQIPEQSDDPAFDVAIAIRDGVPPDAETGNRIQADLTAAILLRLLED